MDHDKWNNESLILETLLHVAEVVGCVRTPDQVAKRQEKGGQAASQDWRGPLSTMIQFIQLHDFVWRNHTLKALILPIITI